MVVRLVMMKVDCSREPPSEASYDGSEPVPAAWGQQNAIEDLGVTPR